jgi:hypothetical protein
LQWVEVKVVVLAVVQARAQLGMVARGMFLLRPHLKGLLAALGPTQRFPLLEAVARVLLVGLARLRSEAQAARVQVQASQEPQRPMLAAAAVQVTQHQVQAAQAAAVAEAEAALLR